MVKEKVQEKKDSVRRGKPTKIWAERRRHRNDEKVGSLRAEKRKGPK